MLHCGRFEQQNIFITKIKMQTTKHFLIYGICNCIHCIYCISSIRRHPRIDTATTGSSEWNKRRPQIIATASIHSTRMCVLNQSSLSYPEGSSSPDPTRAESVWCLVPRPHLRERVWWHPADTSGFITFWREIFLRQSHCRKDNL